MAESSWAHYLGHERGVVPVYAAPGRATDFRGLPPAYISCMEFDPLRDEAILYATHLLEAGVSVELHSYAGTFHGATTIPGTALAARAEHELLGSLRRGLRERP